MLKRICQTKVLLFILMGQSLGRFYFCLAIPRMRLAWALLGFQLLLCLLCVVFTIPVSFHKAITCRVFFMFLVLLRSYSLASCFWMVRLRFCPCQQALVFYALFSFLLFHCCGRGKSKPVSYKRQEPIENRDIYAENPTVDHSPYGIDEDYMIALLRMCRYSKPPPM